jgi:hypothetical protein
MSSSKKHVFNEALHDGEPIEYSAVEQPDNKRWSVLAVSESYTQVFDADLTQIAAEELAHKLNRSEAHYNRI